MEKIIATVVGIVIVLGLISYAILGQASGIRDIGDNAKMEQKKINLMLRDSNIVTGATVLDYMDQGGISITVRDASDQTLNVIHIKPNAMFKMTKTYDQSGDVCAITFKQVDLS